MLDCFTQSNTKCVDINVYWVLICQMERMPNYSEPVAAQVIILYQVGVKQMEISERLHMRNPPPRTLQDLRILCFLNNKIKKKKRVINYFQYVLKICNTFAHECIYK